MNHTISILSVFVVLFAIVTDAEAQEQFLFKFDDPEAAKAWQTVNDGVMGGLSDGRFKINEDKKMEFFGTLSLENNGGFASVRAKGTKFGLKGGDVIMARVRGDGRQYTFNLYAGQNLGGISFRQSGLICIGLVSRPSRFSCYSKMNDTSSS